LLPDSALKQQQLNGYEKRPKTAMEIFQLSILDNMTHPTQTTLAAAGILHLRGILARVLYMPAHEYEALTALCDYAQAQIEARARGGRTITDKRRAANQRNASKARKPLGTRSK